MSERILEGIAASGGIAIGPAYLLDATGVHVNEVALKADAVEEEITRFREAVAKALRQIKRIKSKADDLPAGAAEEINILLEAHMAMLSNSRLVRGVEKRIQSARINAEAALQQEIDGLAKSFAAMDDTYLASRMKDITEVGQRLQRNLQGNHHDGPLNIPVGSIIIAEDITPADTAQIDSGAVQGLIAELGGMDGHTAIMARALDLPAVLGATGLRVHCRQGEPIIVDGLAGIVVVNPSATTLQRYRRMQARFKKEREQLKSLRKLPAITSDGAEIALMVNLELPREMERVHEAGAQGIGLLRTEFMFMNRAKLPDEDEQFESLRTIVDGLKGKIATIRTLDVGGEKLASALEGEVGESANPALGLRAIRLCLKKPKLLETQLAAILRAAAYGPVRILLPMISSRSEVR